jgi:hypothetical protein
MFYLSVCVWGISIFYIEFYVPKAILICACLKSVVIFFSTSLPQYMKVTCVSFVFASEGFFRLVCNMFLMVFISVSFAF